MENIKLDYFFVFETNTLAQALQVMDKHVVSAIAVINKNYELTGILSTRDFLKKFIAIQYMNEEDRQVKDYMTKDPDYIEDYDSNLLIELFTEGHHHYYPVVEQGKFKGMIYRRSIIKELLNWKKNTWFKS